MLVEKKHRSNYADEMGIENKMLSPQEQKPYRRRVPTPKEIKNLLSGVTKENAKNFREQGWDILVKDDGLIVLTRNLENIWRALKKKGVVDINGALINPKVRVFICKENKKGEPFIVDEEYIEGTESAKNLEK